MIRITQLKLPITHTEEQLHRKIAKMLRLGNQPFTYEIRKQSLDARHKEDKKFVYTVDIKLDNESRVLKKVHDKNIMLTSEKKYHFSSSGSEALSHRPIVIGSGPAGLFCAWYLAKAGYCPLVLERGEEADKRQKTVENFWKNGILDPDSNVQFGEGGAGTFSDGKLNTLVKDKYGRNTEVLKTFVRHGADPSIVYQAKPHIGTDILIDVVQSIRREVIDLGGEVRFGHRLERLKVRDGRLIGADVHCAEGEYTLPCERMILAIGHSARDTFENLHAQGVPMQPKPFSMGVRIEHLQKNIDLAQYGRERGKLPAADYSLNVHLPDGTSAYTFCMCPGGEVFAAASEPGGVVTNGMSYSRRDGENANSALLVTLHTEDFPDKSTLGGMYWQREIERAAYAVSGSYRAPAQLAGDFLAHRASTGEGEVKPSYRPGVVWCELHEVLPERITSVLEKAIPELGKKLRGFDAPDAVLTAPETRSSSPVRILRGENLSSAIEGLYPCGEGAGYAGGISSAAVDGMRCAEAVLKTLI